MADNDEAMSSSLASVQAELRRMRTGPDLTDDDLLAQQRLFLTSQAPAAAKVTRATRTSRTTTPSALSTPSPSAPPISTQRPRVSFSPHSHPSSQHSLPTDPFHDSSDTSPSSPTSLSAPSLLIPGVLTSVVERDVRETSIPSVDRIPLGSVRAGFPATFKITGGAPRSTAAAPSSAAPKKSLFALQREQMQRNGPNAPNPPPTPPPTSIQLPPTDRVVEDERVKVAPADSVPSVQWRSTATSDSLSSELQSIRADNDRRLASMSSEEVEEAQAEVAAVLSPALIAALKKRGEKRPTRPSLPPLTPALSSDRLYGQLTADEEEGDGPEVKERWEPTEEKQTTSSSLSPPPFISSKTAWMEPVPSPTSPPDWPSLTWETGLTPPASDSSAPTPLPIGTAWPYWRVDFHGQWLPHLPDSDRYDGLFHHGDHAGRAGYSMQEILHLTHSAHPAQRLLSLTLLSHVLTRIHKGEYSFPPTSSPLNVDFNALLLEHLMVLGVMTVLRVALDDSNLGVMTAAVRGLEALLYREGEEAGHEVRSAAADGHLLPPPTLSDRTLKAWESPITTPTLDTSAIDMWVQRVQGLETGAEVAVNENPDDEVQCMKDAIAGLIQMNALPRLRFLLDMDVTSSPSTLGSPLTTSILHILAMIGQHSAAACRALIATPHLLPLLSSMTTPSPSTSPSFVHLLTLLCLLTSTATSAALYLSSHSSILHPLSYLVLANGLPSHLPPTPSPLTIQLSSLALRLWRRSVGYGRDISLFLTFFPVLMTILTGRGGGEGKGADDEKAKQERESWNVLEGLCGWVEEVAGEDDRDLSISHLSSSVSHAIAQLTPALSASLPTTTLPFSLFPLAGMCHFIASYYHTALPSTTSSPASILTQAQLLWAPLSSLSSSPLISDCTFHLRSSPPSSPGSSLPPFPSTLMRVPALPYIDLLLSFTRCFHALLHLEGEAGQWVAGKIRAGGVKAWMVDLLSSLSSLPSLDVHSALLSYHLISCLHRVDGPTHPVYTAALTLCPILSSCGYGTEVEWMMREVVLAPSYLAFLQEEQVLREGWGKGMACPYCGWRSRDRVTPSTLYTSLSPILSKGADVKPGNHTRGRLSETTVDSLTLSALTSPLTVYLHSNNPTWVLLPFRDGVFLSSVSPSDHVELTRAYVQWVGLLLACGVYEGSYLRTVVVRAVMEVYMLGSEVYSDPALTPSLFHVLHQLLPSPSTKGWAMQTALLNERRGWGWNFFLFFHQLCERYQEEGMGEEGFMRLVQLGLQRDLVKDYRLAVYAMAGEGGEAGEAEREETGGWGQGWWWPKEDSVEVLNCYREYVARRGRDRHTGGNRGSSALLQVAIHHLLCHWFGEEVVRGGMDGKGKAEQIRQKMGPIVDESVIHALCQYRYYDTD